MRSPSEVRRNRVKYGKGNKHFNIFHQSHKQFYRWHISSAEVVADLLQIPPLNPKNGRAGLVLSRDQGRHSLIREDNNSPTTPPLLKVSFFRQNRVRSGARDTAPRVGSKASRGDREVSHIFHENIFRIFSHNFPQKKSGWEVGECISLAPHYHYRLGINRRVWGFGLKENKSVTLKLAYTLEESAFDH